MAHAFETIHDFDMIQTFYADPDTVGGSGEMAITSVSLYFKNKPSTTKNVSGKPDPGVSVRICELVNNEPALSRVFHGVVSYKSYDEIYSFSDASTPTTFGFTTPVKIKTGRIYGIVISLEDASYELWTNRNGDAIVGTSNISPGTRTIKDGKLYLRNNSSIFKALSDTDLKFTVSAAQYTSNTLTQVYTNKHYEFFTISNVTGRFLGGEWAYQQVANATGNVAFVANTNYIIGTGTDFTNDVTIGDRIVVFSNSTYTEVLPVLNVVNTTYLETSTTVATSNTQTKYMIPPSGQVHHFDRVRRKLYLTKSNANSALKFAANSNVITGEDSRATATISTIDVFKADRVRLKGDLQLPSSGEIDNGITFAYFNGLNYLFNTSFFERFKLNRDRMHNINRYAGFILSRSIEVDNASLSSNTDLLYNNKSVVVNTSINVKKSNNELFESPTIETGDLDMFVVKNYISNTYTTTDANNVVIDTEVGGNGIALSKHISTKVTFANNRFAEDIRLIMSAYRPAGTELRVYARVHNSADSEAFDDKAWTPLEYKENGERFSSSDDETDFVEYELGLPQYPESANALPGTFTTQLSNNVVTAFGVNPTTYVTTNDVIKLYNPLIPEDYVVAVVSSSNSTAITLGSAISNNNVVGSGFQVDRLKYYDVAFNNITNDNVSRYYTSSLVEFDKFDSMQYKIVFLSDTTYKVPKVDQVQFIGVSA